MQMKQEEAATIARFLLANYEGEMATTRRVLERVPLAEAQWKPHAKSMTMGSLAAHIVEIPGWVGNIVNAPFVDMAANPEYARPNYASSSELLAVWAVCNIKAMCFCALARSALKAAEASSSC